LLRSHIGHQQPIVSHLERVRRSTTGGKPSRWCRMWATKLCGVSRSVGCRDLRGVCPYGWLSRDTPSFLVHAGHPWICRIKSDPFPHTHRCAPWVLVDLYPGSWDLLPCSPRENRVTICKRHPTTRFAEGYDRRHRALGFHRD
jgi:hypothetical protein